ncbi:MAG: coniferyl aldehyde dehydrogenase [Cycloclasticus sp.]|nr:coniferyl aldehyde dehydrogenase [Cycloclasticus sp.]MBQ0790745.1 coniferyl aldehyde dehydrogenase [Cycloclasticus sp.]
MNSTVEAMTPDIENNAARLIYERQRKAYKANPYPSYVERKANLDKLEKMMVDNQEAIAEAISKDFGNRAHQETQLIELFLSIDGIRYARKKLKKWMKPQRRSVSIWFAGAQNKVLPQPKGIVGLIAPWNYPLFLVMSPLASILASGNRCMIKMAANSSNLAALLSGLFKEAFDEEVVALLPGVKASDFTPLPFDHIVFTGSPETGKTIMRIAADNLVPVTLELGGKSPTIVADDFDIETAADRIMQGKFLNAGQTCVAPDYLFVPEAKVDDFIAAAKKSIAKRYPELASKDYTSIIDEKSFARLNSTLLDAEQKGASITSLMDGEIKDAASRKIAPHVVTNTNDDMVLMQDEIFGPILPIKPYKDLDEALAFINDGERPLALYIFSNNKTVQNKIIKNTLSGGVCINETVLHAGQHDMPFGGVGNSGMGHYHGQEGFNEFSKLRPIFKQFKYPALPLLAPPYGKMFSTIYQLMIKLKI